MPTPPPKKNDRLTTAVGIGFVATVLGVIAVVAMPKGCVEGDDDTATDDAAVADEVVAPAPTPFAEQAFDCSDAQMIHVNLETGRRLKTDVVLIPLHGGAAALLIDGIETDGTSGWCYEGSGSTTPPVTNGRMADIRLGLQVRLENPRDEEFTATVTFDDLRLRCDASGRVTDCFAD